MHEREREREREARAMEEKEDDEERRLLLRSILDLLLAGGYFRSRISSLSAFDKLTGGLAWCITASNADVDFDLFYDDDATLGLKIKVGEAIEASLRKMGCPYPLQAHQIQGLDYPAVLPVVQWLVKRVLATREEFSSQLRRVSLLHFKENYELPEEVALQQSIKDKSEIAHQISILDRPQRVYRRSKNFPYPNNNAERFRCTLLEYGHLGTRDLVECVYDEQLGLAQDDSFDKVIHIVEKAAQSTIVLKPCAINNSLSTFTTSADGPLSGSHVKRIVQLRSEEIQTVTSQYSQNGETKGTHERQVAALVKQIEWQEVQIAKLQQNIARSQFTLENLKATLLQEDKQRREMELETIKLQDLLEENNTALQFFSLIRQLQRLETDELRLQEEDTKERAELEAYKRQLLEQSASPEDVEKFSEIDDVFNSNLEKWKTLRADLATKNRALLVLQRQLDDVPSQTELIQYEHRFVELYLHIQAKLRETRKYYSAYNALAESNELSIKEISLLNSIQSQFEVAMTTAEGQVTFVKSMEGILKGVQKKLDKIGARYHHEQSTIAVLKEKYASAIARQRQYSALLKVFQESCAENENLRKALDTLNPPGLESMLKA